MCNYGIGAFAAGVGLMAAACYLAFVIALSLVLWWLHYIALNAMGVI